MNGIEKKAYNRPHLTVFGEAKKLTASGSNPGKENTGNKADQLP